MQISINFRSLRYFVPILVLLVILIISFLAGSYFANKNREAKKTITIQQENAIPDSDINRSDAWVSPISPYQIKVLNTLRVKEFKKSVFKSRGQDLHRVDLTVHFTVNGVEKTLTFPLIDQLHYSQITKDKNNQPITSESKYIDVYELPIQNGDQITLTVPYIPLGSANTKGSIQSGCLTEKNAVCTYINLGFGDYPIDPDKYLDEVLDHGQFVDFKKMVVISVYIISDSN